jgi:hypothetical protein
MALKFKKESQRAEFEQMLTLARDGKFDQFEREVLIRWCKVRLGVDVSPRHLRRLINGDTETRSRKVGKKVK